MKTFEEITQEIAELHNRKNADYGNAFAELYNKFGFHYPSCRLYEKANRLVQLSSAQAQVKDESIDDTLMDIAAYAIMTLEERSKKY